MPSSAQILHVVLEAWVESVPRVHVGSALDRRIRGARLCRDGNNLAVDGGDPLAPFFVESPVWIVRRIVAVGAGCRCR